MVFFFFFANLQLNQGTTAENHLEVLLQTLRPPQGTTSVTAAEVTQSVIQEHSGVLTEPIFTVFNL